MIIGASGVGKTSIIQRISPVYVPSDTTRRPRPGEIDGVDFFFLTNYGQVVADIESGRFVQVAVGASGDLYATRASSYPNYGIATMPVMAGVIPLFRELGFKATISAFITPPSYEEWMRRMGSHNLGEEQVKRRLIEARQSFGFALSDQQTHFILNDDLATAVGQTTDLLNGKTDSKEESLAKTAAEKILKKL